MLPDQSSPSVEQCHCFTARKTARQISRFYDAQLLTAGLRITQFLTLAVLNEVSDTAIVDLADRLDIEQTAMGKMIATLERRRLVDVRRSPSDRRSRIVALTEAGCSVFQIALPLWRAAQQQFEASGG